MHVDLWIEWCLLPLDFFMGRLPVFAAKNVLFIADAVP